ncbi:hypothetical protein Droror1_Dr00008234 [Drosera rotundifolia]
MWRSKPQTLLILLCRQSSKPSKSASIPPCLCQNLVFDSPVIPFWRPSKTHFSDFLRAFSFYRSVCSATAALGQELDYGYRDSGPDWCEEEVQEEEDKRKIPVKAYFLSTSIDLKGMQSELPLNAIPPTSRTSNLIVLRFFEIYSKLTKTGQYANVDCTQYMVVFQYGSAVLFNVEDDEADLFLNIVRRHASGLLQEMRKDDYAVKENPELAEDMHGGPDCIVLKCLDTDAIRIIGSVLGQSIALDYFVSQVDGMVEEFAEINRAMEKTGTFTMRRKKLFQLVGKANSNLADIILKVGLFDRSEIAWREAKYAVINEYMREEYEVNQRFGNLDLKLKFVEHNIHFLQEALQNRKSHLLEWCVIYLLTIQNVLSVYEIVLDSTAAGPL